MSLTITHPTKKIKTEIILPPSKSESNRLLILNALSGNNIKIHNLSKANDTIVLSQALVSSETKIDIQDAGTSMRFLVAYYCATNQHKILTGTARMCERPIKILVEALRVIGFKINYLEREDFPPLEIIPQQNITIGKEVSIEGNVSSQYISALLMIAPTLSNGLTIHFKTSLTSVPYIELTLDLMAHFGLKYEWNEHSISVPPQSYNAGEYSVSGDWSAASYWYEIAALAEEAEVFLKNLSLKTVQGDKITANWMQQFGVETEEKEEGILLKKGNALLTEATLTFNNNPDLAQTFIVLAAAQNKQLKFTGLNSLRIKETDRITALQNELNKFGVELIENKTSFTLKGTFINSSETIETYNDHRMAMAFAPLALLGAVTIENETVVKKSYPQFWEDMKKAGFLLKQ